MVATWDANAPRKRRRTNTHPNQPYPFSSSAPQLPTRTVLPPPDALVPIRLDLTVDGHRILDRFCWDLRDRALAPHAFAAGLVGDLGLPPAAVAAVAEQIAEQLDQHAADNPELHAPPQSESESESDSESQRQQQAVRKQEKEKEQDAKKSKLKPKFEAVKPEQRLASSTDEQKLSVTNAPANSSASNAPTPTAATPPDAAAAVTATEEPETEADQSADVNRDRENNAETRANPEHTAPKPSARTPAPASPARSRADEERRHVIRLEVRIGRVVLRDMFEWDLSSPLNSVEAFAERLCADVGLRSDHVPAVAHALREQLIEVAADESSKTNNNSNSRHSDGHNHGSAANGDNNSNDPNVSDDKNNLSNGQNNGNGADEKRARTATPAGAKAAARAGRARSRSPGGAPALTPDDVVRAPKEADRWQPKLQCLTVEQRERLERKEKRDARLQRRNRGKADNVSAGGMSRSRQGARARRISGALSGTPSGPRRRR